MNPTESPTRDANPEERAASDEGLELRTRLERLAAAVPGVLYSFRLRPDGTICIPYASPTIESLFGLRPQDLVLDASPIWALVHPDDLPTLLTGIADSARELSSWNAEFRVTPPGRDEIWVGGCSEPTREPDGGTLWHGFLSDTTERKRSELRLRESERRLADTQRIARLGSWELDHGTGAAAWSEELARIFELEEPLDGDPYDAFLTRVHPEDRDRVERELRASIENRATFETTYRLLLSEGRIRWIHSTAETRYDGEGRALLTIGAAQDVTWQRFAEAQLRKLSVVLARTPLSVVITDLDGNIEYVNPAFSQVSGYSAEEVLGRNPRILGSGETPRETFAELWRTIRAGGVWNGELRNRRKSGEPFREEAWISPVVDDDGRTTSYVAIKQDVTEHLLLEDQLRQAQKLEALGRLAGGIAHDFNNLLTIISGNGELLAARLSGNDDALPLLADVRDAADRASTLTRQLLAFSRKQVLEPRVLDVNEVVRRTEAILRRLIGEDIVFSTVLSPAIGAVRVDPGQLEQVILNLAVNARDAMPRGGRLTIETQDVSLGPDYVRRHPYARAGRHVLLSVADSGGGMSDEVKARIFEPFFTTKEQGKGTGLGLAMVFGSVKQSDGHIEVDSEVGSGSRFRIYLPVVPASASTAPELAGSTPRQGTETILLAEDERGVRRIARIALERHGYRVIEAGNGCSALEAVELLDAPIDLLVTDVVMPEMGGRELAASLRERFADLKVLYLSGYIEDEVVRNGISDSAGTFLQKPFTTLDLARKVRAVLDGES
ncbi:MAG: hypothetical protein AMXMBFR36_33360 [Acidobacteriota bacterium]